MARKAPKTDKPTTPAIVPPITLSGDTVPTYDVRLDKVRLTKTIRALFGDHVRSTLTDPKNPDSRVAKLFAAREAFARDAVAEYIKRDLTSEKITNPEEFFKTVPRSWLRPMEHIYIRLLTDGHERGTVRVDITGGPMYLPHKMASGLIIKNVDDAPYNPYIGLTVGSRDLHERLSLLVGEWQAIERDVGNAMQTIHAGLMSCKTVGQFLKQYPSVVEFIPGSVLQRLAAEVVAPAAALAVAPQQVLCSLAKAKGLKVAGCDG